MGDIRDDTKVKSLHRFETRGSRYHKRQQVNAKPDKLGIGTSLTELYLGLAVREEADGRTAIGIAVNDGTYSVDFSVHHIKSDERKAQQIEDLIFSQLAEYQKEHLCKILGAAVENGLADAVPHLCSRLWSDLDMVPFVVHAGRHLSANPTVDEIADSVARKCVLYFGPTKQPRLTISYHNQVLVDTEGHVRLCTLEDYKKSVRQPTWNAVAKYIKDVNDRKLRIVFFSATPQGGGVALMRHALIRFLKLHNVNIEWFVPKPRPDIFRITKTNHNILQGAVPPDIRATDEQLNSIKTWITDNAERYWSGEGGPLRSPEEGGADVIIVDDPQLPDLIPISKSKAPNRPVIFRSHIEVRDELVQEKGSPAEQVWSWMWNNIKHADLFISHPVRSFVPNMVSKGIVGWLPATTDWLDGLNKPMREWDLQYYHHILRQECQAQGQPQLGFPNQAYIAQVARFDPSKGIPDVLRSYGKLRALLEIDMKHRGSPVPQLVICGHSSIDDPDGSLIYDQTMDMIHGKFQDIKEDIVVLRLGPSDQLLNAVLSRASVVLQLSTREGFEVKVSEALHKGKPVIATRTGGIPLQIEHEKSGYLVDRGDVNAVAQHLKDLMTDKNLYSQMSDYASQHVSDEVHTVGNALSWLYLASTVTGGEKLEPNERWVNDLARQGAGEGYGEDEPRLPRHLST